MAFRLSKSACGPFESEFPVPSSLFVFLDIFPIGFQSQGCGGLSLTRDARTGVTDVDLLLLRENICTFVILPGCGFSLLRPFLCLSHSRPCCPFAFCCGDCSFGFQSLAKGITLHVVWGGGEFRLFLPGHPEAVAHASSLAVL